MFELYNLYRNYQHRTPKHEDNFLNSYLVNFSSFYRRSQNWLIVSNRFSCYDPIRILRIWQGPKYSFWWNCLSFWLVPSLVRVCPYWPTIAEVQDISLPAGMWWIRTANYLMLLTNVVDFTIPASFFIPFILCTLFSTFSLDHCSFSHLIKNVQTFHVWPKILDFFFMQTTLIN